MSNKQNDYFLSEIELIIAILLSPKFTRRLKLFVKNIENRCEIEFPKLPLLYPGQRLQFLSFVSKSKDRNGYMDELKALMKACNLDYENRLHKVEVERWIFFDIIPTSEYKPEPEVNYNFHKKYTEISIQVFPWTTETQMKEVFGEIKKAYKKGKVKKYGIERKIVSFYPPKTRYTAKPDFFLYIHLYYLYKKYEKEFESNKLNPLYIGTKRVSRSVYETIWNDSNFQNELAEIQKHFKHKIDDVEILQEKMPVIDQQLSSFDLV